MNTYSVEIEYKMRMVVSVEATSSATAKREARRRLADGELDYEGDMVEESERIVSCELEEDPK